jgi:hypothetical protein
MRPGAADLHACNVHALPPLPTQLPIPWTRTPKQLPMLPRCADGFMRACACRILHAWGLAWRPQQRATSMRPHPSTRSSKKRTLEPMHRLIKKELTGMGVWGKFDNDLQKFADEEPARYADAMSKVSWGRSTSSYIHSATARLDRSRPVGPPSPHVCTHLPRPAAGNPSPHLAPRSCSCTSQRAPLRSWPPTRALGVPWSTARRLSCA